MEDNKTKKAKGSALIPFLVFILIYLGAGIILELKDKVAGTEITGGREVSGNIQGIVSGNNQQLSDAIEALAVLGFSDADIAPYVDKVDTSMDTSAIVSQVLKMIGNNR